MTAKEPEPQNEAPRDQVDEHDEAEVEFQEEHQPQYEDAAEQAEIKPDCEDVGVATSFQEPQGVEVATGTDLDLRQLDDMFK
jgi:hypothetical protein